MARPHTASQGTHPLEYVSFLATSLDGFIARTDGGLDWLDSYGSEVEGDCGFGDFLSSVDALVMGRKTFLAVCQTGQWVYGETPVFVASATLTSQDIPEELRHRVILTRKNPQDITKFFKDQGKRRIYVDGGQLLQSFLKEGLLNQIILTVVPKILGAGISLWGESGEECSLKHLKTLIFSPGLVQNHYEIIHKKPHKNQ